jgi:hypothetical protein
MTNNAAAAAVRNGLSPFILDSVTKHTLAFIQERLKLLSVISPRFRERLRLRFKEKICRLPKNVYN